MSGKDMLRLALFAVGLVLTGLAPAVAEPVSVDGEHDIGQLLERAGSTWEFADEDAIYLLDSLREDWTADGRLKSTVHRVLYVRTGWAIRAYADLRVPFDSAHQRFELQTLRTWRLSDRRWIVSGPTAQVETLPFAVDLAPDYANRREMMLLHDGVELPCVLETVYTIEDTEPFRPGVEGLRTLSRSEPAMISRLVLGFPAGKEPLFAASEELAEPVRGADGNLRTLTFEAGPLEPLPYPHTAESITRVPHVTWSTWKDWPELGAALQQRFDDAAKVDDELREALQEKLKHARTTMEKMRLIAEYVGESTRRIRGPAGWWPAPRRAARTWATAYGDDVDRAVLAAALFREAGLEVSLTFPSAAFGPVEQRVPTLAWTDGPALVVKVEGGGDADFLGWFDPATAKVIFGLTSAYGRALWSPRSDWPPREALGKEDVPGKAELRLDLTFDAEKSLWKGRGALIAEGTLSPFDRMCGFKNEANEYLSGFAAAVVSGAKVTAFNPAMFDLEHVEVGFAVEVPAGERDEQERFRLEVGDGGFLDSLLSHASVQLHDETRGSGVHLPSTIDLRIEVRLAPGDLETVLFPEAITVANSAGKLEIATKNDDDEIVIIRRLVLDKKSYTPAEWLDLRALLLAAGHERNRTILVK